MSQPTIGLTSPTDKKAGPPRGLPEFLASPRREKRRARWIVAGVMLLIVCLVVLRTASVTGWWRIARIEGASMAETYVGSHYQVVCDDCRAPFRCDAPEPSIVTRVTCPNCGYRNNSLNSEQLRRGDRVLLDRWFAQGRTPRRGEVIAIQSPQTGELRTKRVVALPGESWAIRNGDLYINGEIARKTLQQFSDLKILVHDNNYQPTRTQGLPPRWQSETKSTGWQADGFGFAYTPPSAGESKPSEDSEPNRDIDWLQYTQWPCTAALQPRDKPSPISDNDSYNPSRSRNLNWVPDILLACRVECQRNGRFALAIEDDPHRFEITFDRASKSVELLDLKDKKEIARSDERAFADAHRLDIVIAICDQRVFVAEGGQTLITHSYTRSEPCETVAPLSIGGSGDGLKVSDLRVYRDIYYLNPSENSKPWQAENPLMPGHIAVLGDNPPASLDSRQRDEGLPVGEVVGLVYRPFWNAPQFNR
jgi:signal peptidase I